MTRRRAILYGLLAVSAMLVSTAVAWSCALWSPIPASRSLSEAEAARNSPMSIIPNTTPPLQAIVGSDEGPEYLRQSHGLAAAWSKGGHDAEAVTMTGLNHFSIAHQLSAPDSDVTKIVLAQMGI